MSTYIILKITITHKPNIQHSVDEGLLVLVGDVLQQPLAVQPPPVEQPGEVPLTGVAQAGHHRVAGAQVFGDLVRGRHVQAGRGADVEAELVQKSERLGV